MPATAAFRSSTPAATFWPNWGRVSCMSPGPGAAP
jgi:hypothetical protein